MIVPVGPLRPPRAPAAPRAASSSRPSAADRVTLGTADGDVHATWGIRGHALINHDAACELPDEMPAFFRDAADRLEALASQPDRWKLRGVPRLDAINRPDHHINYELIGDRTLPPERYGFVGMVAAEQLQKPGTAPIDVGVLPYAIAENLEKLTTEFALWRHEVDRNGEDSVLARQLADNAVYTAGLLGHYCGDAAQPLHVTVHHDGWDEAVEPNPEHFSTERGIHFRFESGFVNATASAEEVAGRLRPATVLAGDTLEVANAFCTQSHDNVRTLYTLDRDGALDPENPSAEGEAFVTDCLADGAQFLRDLWYTAWVRSKALARQIHDPEIACAPGNGPHGK